MAEWLACPHKRELAASLMTAGAATLLAVRVPAAGGAWRRWRWPDWRDRC
ncbi:MAG: hypothetical protein U1F77_01750 [Kiritimatiellia bacterium]